MSRKTVTLTGRDPAGWRFEIRTAAGYDYAGLIQHADGKWTVASKGWSQASVLSNARRAKNRTDGTTGHAVVEIAEEAPAVIEAYLQATGSGPGTRVDMMFRPGTNWKSARELGLAKHPSRSFVRKLAREGWTAIQLVTPAGRRPDFSMDELLPAPCHAPLLGGSLIGSRIRGAR